MKQMLIIVILIIACLALNYTWKNTSQKSPQGNQNSFKKSSSSQTKIVLGKDSYAINNKAFHLNPQHPPVLEAKVTLKARRTPMNKVIQQISRQTGIAIFWDNFSLQSPQVTISLRQVPFWEAIQGVCTSVGKGFKLNNQEPALRIPSGKSIKYYQTAGPFFLAWYPMRLRDVYTKNKWQKKKCILVKLMPQPQTQSGMVDSSFQAQFLFHLGGDKKITIAADHTSQDGRMGFVWRFYPRPEFQGLANVKVKVPMRAATGLKRYSLDYKEGFTLQVGKAKLTLKNLQSNNKKVEDPKHWAKKIKVKEISCSIIFAQESITHFPIYTLQLADARQNKILPFHSKQKYGKNFLQRTWKFHTEKLHYQPQKLIITQLQNYRNFDIDFELKKVPLR